MSDYKIPPNSETIITIKKDRDKGSGQGVKRGPIQTKRRNDFLPRRRNGMYLNFYDLGQVRNGEAWDDLEFVASPAPSSVVSGSRNDLTTVASLTLTDWNAYKTKLFEIPIEDWTIEYRKLTYDDAYRYGIDVYTGDPSLVNPANQPNHLDMAKYFSVARNRQRVPMDYYLQAQGVKVAAGASVGSTSILVDNIDFPELTRFIPSGTEIWISRNNIVTTTADATLHYVTDTTVFITPLQESISPTQDIYIADKVTNKDSWTERGLIVPTGANYFNLITLNSFHNIGLWFGTKITSTNDYSDEAVPFLLNKPTDFFLVPALVGTMYISADASPFANNTYLNFDFRPWNRTNYLENEYFESTLPSNSSNLCPIDTPVFCKADYSFYFVGNPGNPPFPVAFNEILQTSKNAIGARQWKEELPGGLTSPSDFFNNFGLIYAASAINAFDINPDSYGYVPAGALLAVAKQGSNYFYFWHNGSPKINNQYNQAGTLMQHFQWEYSIY